MKIGFGNFVIVLIMFLGSALYFFYKSASNAKGLIINHMFTLSISQASTFYFVIGCLCILLLLLCVMALYKYKKR